MSIWARLRKRKRAVASATVMSLVLSAVVALSITYEGVATADVEMNDGGVWVSNNESVLVGRLNYPIGEIDASLAALSQDVDLLQRGAYSVVGGVRFEAKRSVVDREGESNIVPKACLEQVECTSGASVPTELPTLFRQFVEWFGDIRIVWDECAIKVAELNEGT